MLKAIGVSLVVAVCIIGAACGGSSSKPSTAPRETAATTASVVPLTAVASTTGTGGGSGGGSTGSVDLSLGGNGFPLTMQAPSGSVASDDGGGGIGVEQEQGDFGVDVFKTSGTFSSARSGFQGQKAPYAFERFVVDDPDALVYVIHNTAGGQNIEEYLVYVEPSGAPGYYCMTHPGTTDANLYSQQGAQAVLAACKTLTAK